MKNLVKLMMLFAIVPTLLLSSCKETIYEANEYSTLSTYMADNGLDLGAILVNADGAKFVIAAKEGTELDGRFIIDIRSENDFNLGHIAGAKNYALGEVLDACAEAEAAGKMPVIVCYTGQTACFATSLCRIAGYSDTQALKWGMSGWSDATDKWTANIDNIAKDHANWSYDAAPSLHAFGSPLVTTNNESGAAILQARIETVLAQGFGAASINAIDVLENPSGYFVNNFFSEVDYNAFGHIAGASRIQPLGLSSVSNLDPSKTICTYCYTGQTSAVVTAYLRVLGYDAKSITFGMNKLYNSNEAWSSNQWGGDSNSKHFELVTE